jgi:opacity protein-like surface antigen
MNVLRRSLFASVFASTLLFSSVPAQTLMGTPNVGFRFDLITLGNDELDDLMGTIYGGSVEATFVINSQIDLNVLGSYVESEGSRDLVKIDYKDKTLGGNLVFHFEPKGSITPYALAGLHYVESDIIAKRDGVRIASEDSDVGMEVGGGVEMLPVRNVVLNLKLSYVG